MQERSLAHNVLRIRATLDISKLKRILKKLLHKK